MLQKPDFQIAGEITSELFAHVMAIVQIAQRGEDIAPAVKNLAAQVEHEVVSRVSREQVRLRSPLCDVSNDAWNEAKDYAEERIFEATGEEREATALEIEHALEDLEEIRSGRIA